MEFLEGILYMLWRGIAIGVIISAPMGPVGILCVQRTLEKGRVTGFFTGVGAAISDLFYCLLTGFGLSFIEEFLKANQNVIQIIGSVVLVLFGIYLFKSNPARTLRKPEAVRSTRRRDVLQGFLFTFSNPLIIFLIIGLFARFNFLLPEITPVHYVIGFVFIFIGALLWWWIVSYFVDKVRSHFNLRSMWLINKITGGIILVFALVGVITAVTGIASADTREPVYLNSTRGFGALGDAGSIGAPLILDNNNCDTLVRCLPIDRVEDFSFSFRTANLHNQSGKSYAYSLADGHTAKVEHPAWGLCVKGDAHTLGFRFRTVDNRLDELIPAKLMIWATVDGVRAGEVALIEDVDMFSGENSFRLIREADKYFLLGGNRRYEQLLIVMAPEVTADSIGLWVAPGGAVSVDDITLRVFRERLSDPRRDLSHFADPDVRDSYFMRTVDPIEGEWEIFDRQFDDSNLRVGGNYRLAIVRDKSGYKMIYLSGASKNPDKWEAGMEKGRLVAGDFVNVFDVVWLDPSATPLEGPVKAQFQSPDILTLQFVGHASTLRLRKSKYYGTK